MESYLAVSILFKEEGYIQWILTNINQNNLILYYHKPGLSFPSAPLFALAEAEFSLPELHLPLYQICNLQSLVFDFEISLVPTQIVEINQEPIISETFEKVFII